MQIYDIHVQDAQRLPPQESLKEKFQTIKLSLYTCITKICSFTRKRYYYPCLQVSRIKYLSAIYVPANLTQDTQEIRTCYF